MMILSSGGWSRPFGPSLSGGGDGARGANPQEGDAHCLRATPVEDGRGRGLEVLARRLEGEVVCPAPALFYDDFSILREFLRQNPRFADRVVKIEGVKKNGQILPIFAILVGVAQYAQHFQGIRGRPNAALQFSPVLGFNSTALEIVASTRTGVGIAAGAPVLLDYGCSFDVGAARKETEGSSDIFSGALDALFESQRDRLPDVVAADDARKAAAAAEVAQAAAEEAAAARAAQEAAAEVAAAEEKARADAKEAEVKAAAAAQQAAAGAKRKAEAVAGSDGGPADQKRHKSAGIMVGTLPHFAAEVLLDGARLMLRNTTGTNKKIPGDTAFMTFTTDTKLSETSPCSFAYDLTMKSDIVASGTMKRLKLDKFIKEVGLPTQDIYCYTRFPQFLPQGARQQRQTLQVQAGVRELSAVVQGHRGSTGVEGSVGALDREAR